jgi:hypothetical protein
MLFQDKRRSRLLLLAVHLKLDNNEMWWAEQQCMAIVCLDRQTTFAG